MSLSPEIIIERKKYRQRLAIWQIATILAIAAAFFLFVNKQSLKNISASHLATPYIASITIDNDLIIEDERRDNIIASLKDDRLVKAVIINLNSPGSTAVGAEIIYKILKDISKEKPVVTAMNSIATSGAYLIALAGEHIVAHHCTLTGSIGVIIRSFEVTDLADRLGVKFINLKTNQNKAALSMTEKLSPATEDVIMESLQDTYEYFVSLVMESRKLTRNEVLNIADGRVFTGNQALKYKLIDAIGTKKDSIEWLKKNKKLPAGIEVREVSLKEKPSLWEEVLGNVSTSLKTQFTSSARGFLAVYNR